MIKAIKEFTEEFLKQIKDKPVRIISHYDTDGISSAAIVGKALQRIDKKFSIRIVKGLDKEIINQELKRNGREVLLFTDLASGSLDYFQNLKNPIFILDHHEINKQKLKKVKQNVRIINPHLFGNEETCGAGICYFFAKAISTDNVDLAKLAVIGIIGDRQENNLSKFNQQIIKEAKELIIKKGLLIFSATRPLKYSLEYSTSIYIPGVTGSSIGVVELLRETRIDPNKTLYELSDEEMSRLITAILVKRASYDKKEEIVGNIYLLKFFNQLEDVRELSVLINACSRLGYPDIALSFCLENEKAKQEAQEIYIRYKQELISALREVEKINKIEGNGFVIINAKDKIKDTIIGTICSILSSSLNYESGTILIGMAYNGDKIKVSARIAGHDSKNLKEILERVVVNLEAEVGGHQRAAGCLIRKQDEEKFLEALKRNLEVEIVKI